MGDSINPFAVLGVDETASRTEIDAAHRDLVRAWHPDRFAMAPPAERGAAEQRMAEVNFAHQLLTDERTRAQYRRTQQKRRAAAAGRADVAEPPTASPRTTAPPSAAPTTPPPSPRTTTVEEPVDYRSRASSEFTVGRSTAGTPWVSGSKRRRWGRSR